MDFFRGRYGSRNTDLLRSFTVGLSKRRIKGPNLMFRIEILTCQDIVFDYGVVYKI